MSVAAGMLAVALETSYGEMQEAAALLAATGDNLPEAERARLLHKAATVAQDPETLVALASVGVEIPDPIPGLVIDALRAGRTSSEAAAELPQVTSARQLLNLAQRFEYDSTTLEALDGRPVEVGGAPYTTRLIRSLTELERNADDMHNCTAGYAKWLRRGDMMIAILGEDGRPRFNAHIRMKPEGAEIGEVSGVRNNTLPEDELTLTGALKAMLKQL